MLSIHYSFVRYQDVLEDFIFEEDFNYIKCTKELIIKLLTYTYLSKNRFFIDRDQEIYTPHYVVISQTNFKYNHRYYSHVRARDKMIIYYPGRELTTDTIQNKIVIKRIKRPIEEMFLKTIYAGLNHYDILKSENLIHFLIFSPMFVYFYKDILKISKFFFELNEKSLRFIYFNFKQSKKVFKKIKSIKKNLKKKNLMRTKQEDYVVVNL